MAKAPEQLGAAWYRSFLTPQGKTFYDTLHAQLLWGDHSGRTVFTIKSPHTAARDCFAAYKALQEDHPEFFFLGLRLEFTSDGRNGVLRYPLLYTPSTIRRIPGTAQAVHRAHLRRSCASGYAPTGGERLYAARTAHGLCKPKQHQRPHRRRARPHRLRRLRGANGAASSVPSASGYPLRQDQRQIQDRPRPLLGAGLGRRYAAAL